MVALLAERHGGKLARAKRERALADEVHIGGKRVALAFPQTFMNDSGESVVLLVKRYGVTEPAQVVVVHDELDLPLGRVKLKEGGGLAGHNGLRSIKAHLHTDAFLRVRIGDRQAARRQGPGGRPRVAPAVQAGRAPSSTCRSRRPPTPSSSSCPTAWRPP